MLNKVTVCRVKGDLAVTFEHVRSFGYPDCEEWAQFSVRAALACWYIPDFPAFVVRGAGELPG
jgi:hypothetical protein